MTDTSNQPQMFISRPLAEMQSTPSQPRHDREEPEARMEPEGAVRQVHQVPVVDISFEDLPDEDYQEFHFPLKTTPGIIYTLGISDDAVLFETMEMLRESAITDAMEFVFSETFRRAVDADGLEVEGAHRQLMRIVRGKQPGKQESRKYLMSVMNTAIERWAEELTDTSMRPMNRAQRRARRR